MSDEGVPMVSVDQVPDASDDAVLLDVREDNEWQRGHAPGALHIPLADVPARMSEVAGGGQIHVVCRVGGRSAQATAYLVQNGVDAVNVDGGMLAWEQAGRPLTSDDGRPASVL